MTVVAQSRILYGTALRTSSFAVFVKVLPTRGSQYVALLFGASIVGGFLVIGALIQLSGSDLPRAAGQRRERAHLPGQHTMDDRARPRGTVDTPPIEKGVRAVHVIVATDGSRTSFAAARRFQWIVDSRETTHVTVVGPCAAVPFANELTERRHAEPTDSSVQDDAAAAVDHVAAVFDRLGPDHPHPGAQRLARRGDHPSGRGRGCGPDLPGVRTSIQPGA